MEDIRLSEKERNEREAKKVFEEFLEALAVKVDIADEDAVAVSTDEFDDRSGLRKAAKDSVKRCSRKRRNFFRSKNFKKVVVSTLVLVTVMVAVAGAANKITALYPYALTSNDEVICYVQNKEDAQTAVKLAVGEFTDEDELVKVVSTGDSLKVEQANTTDIDKKQIKDPDEAADLLIEALKDKSAANPEISIVSTKVESRTFTPTPNYVKDETKLAGYEDVREEGRDGTKEVTVATVSVNGKVKSEEDVIVDVIDEGKPATIVKGTLGLPKGEDWETYKGDPVYSDGADLVVTAKSYIGKVPYVKGGHNINSGVDCVGFVREMYRLYGIKLSPYLGREGVAVSYKNAQPGDILIFAHHVGIYIGNGKLVHAANPKLDICISPVSSCTGLKGVRRIIKN